ncbi:MAG: hypothetical protein ABI137_09355 [Antricoccus sp.]
MKTTTVILPYVAVPLGAVRTGLYPGPQRLALLRAAPLTLLHQRWIQLGVALGGSTDLIVQHTNVAVDVTDMFGIGSPDASATRYNGNHDRNTQR